MDNRFRPRAGLILIALLLAFVVSVMPMQTQASQAAAPSDVAVMMAGVQSDASGQTAAASGDRAWFGATDSAFTTAYVYTADVRAPDEPVLSGFYITTNQTTGLIHENPATRAISGDPLLDVTSMTTAATAPLTAAEPRFLESRASRIASAESVSVLDVTS